MRAVVLAIAAVMPATLQAVEWPTDAEPGAAFRISFGPHQPVTPRLMLRIDYVTDAGGKTAGAPAAADSPAGLAFAPGVQQGMRIPLEWTVANEPAQAFQLRGVKIEADAYNQPGPWTWAAGAGLAALFTVAAVRQEPIAEGVNCGGGACPR